METIKHLNHINMSGVKRFKVYRKDDRLWLNCIDRFFTLEEAEKFRDTLDYECVIVYD